MDAVNAMKATVQPDINFGRSCKYIYYDENSDALYSTNGHLLFVLPKRDLKEQPISEDDRGRFARTVVNAAKKPTVRLAHHYLKRVIEFFDLGPVDGEYSPIDIHIDANNNAVTFTSPEAPGRVAVLMPMRIED